MKFFIVLLFVILLQVISTIAFVIPNEMRWGNTDGFLFFGILAAYLVMYYVFRKKAAMKLDISGIRFNVYFFASWVIVAVTSLVMINSLLDIGILQGAGGWFSGIEYFFMFMIYLMYAAGILVLNFLIWCVSKIINEICESGP